MKAELTFEIEAPSLEAAGALAGKIRKRVAEETTVYASSATPKTQNFDVLGVDTSTRERFAEQVEAASADAAESEVATDTKIVVVVRKQGGAP